MSKTITFVPRKIAENMDDGDAVLISVIHSDQPFPEHHSGWEDIHYFVFDDITMSTGGLITFDLDMATKLVSLVKTCDSDIVVHCEAGMSRSAAIAKWVADNYDFDLVLHPKGIGTVAHYNELVYSVLDASIGQDMASYYRSLEMDAFTNPKD